MYHPLGVGDHIACSGIVREYAKKYDKVGLVCLKQYAPSIGFLYRDLPQVTLECISSHNDVAAVQPHYGRTQTVGTFDVESGVQYERQFYKMAGVPFSKLWDSFHVERDRQAEAALAQKMEIKEPYIFLHDDKRFPVDRSRLPAGIRIVEPDLALTQNIFDYCGIIEGAQELHVIDSSFMFLIDCLPAQANQKLVLHRYPRPNMPWNLPILKKPWVILA